MVKPAPSFSISTVALVLILSAVSPAAPNWPDNAMEKQPAWAAAISSSGLVPLPLSKRVLKEYWVSDKTPLSLEMRPFPSLMPPFQTADALRFIIPPEHEKLIETACETLNIQRRGHRKPNACAVRILESVPARQNGSDTQSQAHGRQTHIQGFVRNSQLPTRRQSFGYQLVVHHISQPGGRQATRQRHHGATPISLFSEQFLKHCRPPESGASVNNEARQAVPGTEAVHLAGLGSPEHMGGGIDGCQTTVAVFATAGGDRGHHGQIRGQRGNDAVFQCLLGTFHGTALPVQESAESQKSHRTFLQCRHPINRAQTGP